MGFSSTINGIVKIDYTEKEENRSIFQPFFEFTCKIKLFAIEIKYCLWGIGNKQLATIFPKQLVNVLLKVIQYFNKNFFEFIFVSEN